MAPLFEYGSWQAVSNRENLRILLQNIWQQRRLKEIGVEIDEFPRGKKYQPFLRFDGDQIRANNYVGFIQNGPQLIEIYPKVFRHRHEPCKELMLKHIFYWFRYCRKWQFPFNQASLDVKDIDTLPELIIHLIANQMLETITDQPFQMYQETEEALLSPKGSVNFKRYIQNSLTRGLDHRIECDYEPFLFDNKVNRIIKYCARLLLNQTHFPETLRTLQDTLFILDEVDDTVCTSSDIDSLNINPFFEGYTLLMESCKIILDQQLYSNTTDNLTQWCLLFPMEYIFEDFVAGFLERKFSKEWNVEYQKSDKWLTDSPKAFNMQHDIFLTAKDGSNRKIIIDTKYKIRASTYKNDLKKGISQDDLYQVTSYAFKRGCTEVFLLYPNISENRNDPDTFKIKSGFNERDQITVTTAEIPFWSLANFQEIENALQEELGQLLKVNRGFH